MGTIKHDSIVVTSWSQLSIFDARKVAMGLGLLVTDTVVGHNGYLSFLIAPDGSKEGWRPSDEADQARKDWIAWARTHDPDRCLEWIHVSMKEREVATVHDFSKRGDPEEGEKADG